MYLYGLTAILKLNTNDSLECNQCANPHLALYLAYSAIVQMNKTAVYCTYIFVITLC